MEIFDLSNEEQWSVNKKISELFLPFWRINEVYESKGIAMSLNQDQSDALKEAVIAAIALNIHDTVVVETVLEKVSEIPELDHLTANTLADVLQDFEVEVGSLLSVLMLSKNKESMALMDQTLARRRIDRIDEFGV